MPIAAADLLSPTGNLVPTLFPSDSAGALAARLEAYISEGATKAAAISDATVRDRATLHYAYYRAYEAIYVRMAGQAASATLDVLSRTYTADQLKAFAALRDHNLAAFSELLPSAPAPGVSRPSSSSAAVFAW